MFSGRSTMKIPKSLNECTARDEIVCSLYLWAERLENWGGILFVLMIIWGAISSIAATLALIDVNEDAMLITFISSAVTWALYAFIEYITYHALALLISALASITQSTLVTAKVALLNANTYDEESTVTTPKKASPTATVSHDSWTYKTCGSKNAKYFAQCQACGERRS